MKSLVLAAVLAFAAGSAHAASCNIEAANKKLAGAAKTSFVTKCSKDAEDACAKDSDAKKLAGAARTSHMKKCVADAVGG